MNYLAMYCIFFHLAIWAPISGSVAVATQRASRFRTHAAPREDDGVEGTAGNCQGPIRQPLTNDDDVSFMGSFGVGSQKLDVIPDTGSFEFVVFSDLCEGCGVFEALYHGSKSKTLEQGSLTAKQTYGSGDTTSQEAYDNVYMQCLHVNHQMFWQVVSATMPILAGSPYGGIMGLGPPNSNILMAEEEYTRVQQDISSLERAGMDVSGYQQIVQNLKDVYEFSKTESVWLSGIGMHSFSICLKPGSGQPGVLVYNDDSVDRFPSLFQTVRVEQGMYWATRMTDVQIGDETVGCAGAACSAVMDTGTSLIAAPARVIRAVEALIDDFSEDANNCEDLSAFPDLTFMLDGQKFSLPPQAYVGIVEGDAPEWALDLLPSLRRRRDANKGTANDAGSSGYCSMLLMNMDSDDDGPEEWIFGLPFFRRYYTTFRLDANSTLAHSMHFAETPLSCNIGTSSNLRVAQSVETAPLRIPAHKLRPPRRWAQKHGHKYGATLM